ncbi:MAG: glycerol-3-phosphate dehydrogenase/oxidase [Tetrasphaera sp.]|nr:glycerol-3-phosphate dehydrogenase/oxidase [Tetrasphaera sp.]
MLTIAPHPTHLTPARRRRSLERLATERFDVIVVGGGVTGAGAALDAASRGLRTALVERVDLAAGTSRWSSKLVHGGLRYLAKGDLAVAWESASERAALLGTIAPHLCRPVPFVIPLDETTGPGMGVLTEVGTRVGDVLRIASRTGRRLLPPTTRLTTNDALVHAPGLRPDRLRGALMYWDGQLEDDARLVTVLARTAAAYGAEVVTRCAATGLSDDRVTLTDTLTGESIEARGIVLNATGVWVGDHEPGLTIAPSRGSHIVVRSRVLGDPRSVFTAPVPDHFGRYVFGIPQPDGLTYIGLTDEPVCGADGIAPAVPSSDEHFLLETINRVLRVPLTTDDVIGRFAGLRPLVRLADRETADISRRHLLIDEPGRPLTLAGGKLTTYRRMAQDAIDAVCRRLAVTAPCRTRDLPLAGATSRPALRRVAAPERLVRRYGALAPVVHDLMEREPWLAVPVAPGCPTQLGELAYAVLAEGAMTVEDLLERRTRVSLVESEYAAARPPAAEVLDVCLQALDDEVALPSSVR